MLPIAQWKSASKVATIPPMTITRIKQLLWLSLIILTITTTPLIRTMLNMPVTLRSMIIRPIRVTTAT